MYYNHQPFFCKLPFYAVFQKRQQNIEPSRVPEVSIFQLINRCKYIILQAFAGNKWLRSKTG